MSAERELKPGTADYDRHVREEIDHYASVYDDPVGKARLMQPVPPCWTELERRASGLIAAATGQTVDSHVVTRLRSKVEPRLLSLGSGPGGVEIGFARQVEAVRVTCMDISPELLEMGRARTDELGLKFEFQVADLNTVELPESAFDLIWCHASLHHVLELEHLIEQIDRALRPRGEFIVVDISTANGYQMWPETRPIAKALFKALPPQFRLNHTAYGKRELDEELWEGDTSKHGMECVRSEDVLPTLRSTLREVAYVPYFSLCRRFLDTMYGPNYDLTRPLDAALFEWLWQLDLHYLSSSHLAPETFFGIYQKRH